MTSANGADGLDGVLQPLDAMKDDLRELYEHLHANPEVAHCETETADLIVQRLEGDGYDVQRIGGGVVGVIESGQGPTVLYRADIDALPVKEETGLPYASIKTMEDRDGNTVPVMHACGHDVHITAGLGAARLMAQGRDHWSGTYVTLFQPAEEVGDGARGMVADGLTDKIPAPEIAFGQHVMGGDVSAGQVGVRGGAALSTAVSVRVTIPGKGTHGSMPHLGVDPIVIAAATVMRLQTLVSRETAPTEFAIVTVGSIQGGTSANIIPESVELLLNVRAYDEDTRQRLVDGIRRIVSAECEAAAAPREPEVEVYQSYPLTDNDEAAAEQLRGVFEERFGQEAVVEPGRATASEDFSEVPRAFGIPYVFWFLGGFAPDDEQYPNHNPKFAPREDPTLSMGVEAAVTAVMSRLGKPSGGS